MRRALALLAILALVSVASAQAFTVAARAGLDGVGLEATLEVRAYQALELRIAPVVTARATYRAGAIEATAVAGVAVTWLPPDSVWAVQAQVHYRLLWSTSAGARGSPELLLALTGALW